MTKFRALMAGVVIAALASIGVLWAQGVTPTTLNGNEVIVAAIGGPGGPSTFVSTGQLRNSTGYVTTTVTGSTTIPNNTNRYIITAQPSVATVSLPASPVFDGSMIEVVNGTAAAFATNAVTVNPNTGQTLVGGNITITTLAAGASVEVIYSLPNNTWYRVR